MNKNMTIFSTNYYHFGNRSAFCQNDNCFQSAHYLPLDIKDSFSLQLWKELKLWNRSGDQLIFFQHSFSASVYEISCLNRCKLKIFSMGICTTVLVVMKTIALPM